MNCEMDKISVIVPAYNAENTIEKCIRSIANNILENIDSQNSNYVRENSIRIQYEIIAVDDGSTDCTLNILTQLSEEYKTLKVVHQCNQGVSIARQTAIGIATGNYFAFCDADDYVEEDWLITMYKAIKRYDVDFVKFEAIIEYPNAPAEPSCSGQCTFFNRQTALEAFIEHRLINGILWTNIFKADLFKGIKFNAQLTIFEDADVIFQIIQKCTSIVRIETSKYHYVVYDDSLSNRKMSLKRVQNTIQFWDSVISQIPNDEVNLKHKASIAKGKWLISALGQMYKHNIKNDKVEREIIDYIRQYKVYLVKSSSIKNICLLMMVLFSSEFCRKIFSLIYKVYPYDSGNNN